MKPLLLLQRGFNVTIYNQKDVEKRICIPPYMYIQVAAHVVLV